MKKIKSIFIEIFRSDRSILVMMILNFVLATAFLIISLIEINSGKAVVKTGYGDIGGYRDGSWSELILFPLLAILYGVCHDFLAIRIYEKRGGALTRVFLAMSMFLIIATFIVLKRLSKGV